MDRTERINAALSTIGAKLNERKSLLEQLAERDSVISELRGSMNAMQSRFEALKNMTLWAELASGATVHVGDTVRYLMHNYTCTKEHSKTLLRAPTNGEYWQIVED